jgi:oligoribonuclease
VFVPAPGPDSESARGIAAKHGGALTGLTGEPDSAEQD